MPCLAREYGEANKYGTALTMLQAAVFRSLRAKDSLYRESIPV